MVMTPFGETGVLNHPLDSTYQRCPPLLYLSLSAQRGSTTTKKRLTHSEEEKEEERNTTDSFAPLLMPRKGLPLLKALSDV